jgi:class 3 adenylate cyclase/tetratricopeptide (TPR) repeat protein
MAEGGSGLVTILFTDLVGSTELLSRAGDEAAQRIFHTHRRLLSDAVAAHGGHEVKWLGDGLMVGFPSAADAVGCAVAMQQASRRPVHGERLAIRVGLTAGETLRDSADYFGLPVVVARRLCDQADAGQILCTDVVAGLLAGRPDFAFADLGKRDLKGVPQAVATFEVRYETGPITGILDRMPFVGRVSELERLTGRLAEAVAGRGGLALVAGEPGIGKTRLIEELAERAQPGSGVLWGSCFEGGWAPPYLPFAEAVETLTLAAEPEELRADLGSGGPPLAQLVPALRKVLPDLPEPVSLQPDEERFRLFDAVTQLFVARSERAPLVLVLDDLHWADKGTVAMLRHLARFASRHRILVLGTYRDAEVDRAHPLTEALAALPRETSYVAIHLAGLDVEGVTQLLALAGEHEVSEKVGAAWARETEGNPFFLKELLRHLIDEGKLYREPDGSWATTAPLRELDIPSSVRDVVGRRLSRLAEPANRLLTVAAAFESAFRFNLVAGVAELPEGDALDALDEALAAQLVQPAGDGDTCTFTHALVRYTIYADLSPPRRLRLHRRVAEALEAAYGTEPSPAQAGEIASQYHRSAGLPGAERGVEPAVAAAAHAEATGAHDEAAGFLRMALDLCPKEDPRRLRILDRLGIALTWALHFDEAVAVAGEAAEATAAVEGPEAAADYLSEVAYACAMAGSWPHAWTLAPKGLSYAGAKRDVAWARLVMFDHQLREAGDPEYPGIPLDTPERAEAAAILRAARLDPMGPAPMEAVFSSREEALTSVNIILRAYWYGDFAGAIPLFMAEVEKALPKGQLARAARAEAFVAFNHAALGHFDEMRDSIERAEALEARLGMPVPSILQTKEAIATATDEGLEAIATAVAPLTARVIPALAWLQGGFYAWSARIAARLGQPDEALRCLGLLVPWLERAPAWTIGFPMMASHAAETLWVLERLDHVEVIEVALREKVVAPDFRNQMVDGRLALARLCALTGRHDEAVSWFARAREVLAEQGARPLLAIADHDEALMYVRRGQPGDLHRARPLLDAARRQFEDIGMTGWLRRAEELTIT